MAGVIALLGSSASALASLPASAAAAHLVAGSIVSVAKPVTGAVAKPVKVPKTARLCGTAKAGQATCYAIRQTDTIQPPGLRANAVSPYETPLGFGPSSLASAYNLDQSKGSGQTVAVIDAYDDPYAESDLATYRRQYGLGDCTTANRCFTKVNQYGEPINLPRPDGDWSGEISLDLDMVSAACPKCNILLVEAATSYLEDLGNAVNQAVTMGARYVSNSYGASENGSEPSLDAAYYNHPGVVITASTGDNGYGASYPATGAYVTAVGGTSLNKANNTRGWTESVWNNTHGATGSGCSTSVAKPSFQTGVTTGCSNRAEADVSAVSDPVTGVAVFNTWLGGWGEYGGTSAASPIIASVYALAGGSDRANAYPYSHPGGLYDVTSGQDGTCTQAVLCGAGSGWDGPTGLGSPNGTSAFGGVAVTNPGAQTGAVGSLQNLQVHASDSISGVGLSYAATGLPTGLRIDQGTGLISGTVSAGGRYTVSITAADTTSRSGSATFSWVFQVPGALVPVPPVRVLDTRIGKGAARAPVAAGADLVLQITGKNGVPTNGVSAVVVNLTVTQPTSPGWVSAFPDGTPLPAVSNLNFVAGQSVPNLAIVPVGTDGAIRLHNGSRGTVQLVADVSGYYLAGASSPAGGLITLAPARVLDTRIGNGAARAPIAADADLVVQITGNGGVSTNDVSAVVVNLAVTQPTSPGWVSAFRDGAPLPAVSNLNFVAGQSVPNLAIVPVGADGAIRLHNGSRGTVHLVADISGYYLAGTPSTAGALAAVTPDRVLDTRIGNGAARAAVAAGADLVLHITGKGGVPNNGVSAVVVNVTVTQPTSPGWVSAFRDGTPLPAVSNLNFVAGQSVPNLAIVPVGADGAIRLHNGSRGTVHLVADVCGYSLD